MNLFFKIFLWFLAAVSLMIGIVIFINWTVQTEPVVSRWQISVRYQMNVYADTASQIYQSWEQDGLAQFLLLIRQSETVSEVDLVAPDGSVWLGDSKAGNYRELATEAIATGD